MILCVAATVAVQVWLMPAFFLVATRSVLELMPFSDKVEDMMNDEVNGS